MIYVFGDLHGEVGKLNVLLDQIDVIAGDSVVFLGDYVDRGANSLATIQRLIAYRSHMAARGVVLRFQRGNHDQMMLDARYAQVQLNPEGDGVAISPPFALWMNNGGLKTLSDYGATVTRLWPEWQALVPRAHWEFLEDTQAAPWDTKSFRFVHAGVLPPGVSYWAEAPDPLIAEADPHLWIRETFLEYQEDWPDGKTVVYGHTITPNQIKVDRNKIGIDTGSFAGGQALNGVYCQGYLTCLCLDDATGSIQAILQA
jgi:serine/threonine protein phosphatase 1